MDISVTPFGFGFSVSCILSFVPFLSGYTRDMIAARFGAARNLIRAAIPYATIVNPATALKALQSFFLLFVIYISLSDLYVDRSHSQAPSDDDDRLYSLKA
jgi:hypothetical protein